MSNCGDSFSGVVRRVLFPELFVPKPLLSCVLVPSELSENSGGVFSKGNRRGELAGGTGEISLSAN